jgi:hypothetical protein
VTAISDANLKWFYSGGAANNDPALSIGGAKSSVEVSATALNNLFDDVTGTEAAAGVTRYRVIYVQNKSADAGGWPAPVAWIGYQPRNPSSPYTADGETYAFAFAASKNSAVAALANENTAPSGPSFSTAASKGAGVALPDPDYMQDDYVAVYLRMVTPSSQPQNSGSEYQLCIENP